MLRFNALGAKYAPKSTRNLMDSSIKNDLKIDPKNRIWIRRATLGDPLETPLGAPWAPGDVQAVINK